MAEKKMAEKKMARGEERRKVFSFPLPSPFFSPPFFSPPFSPVFFIILTNNPPKNKATALQANPVLELDQTLSNPRTGFQILQFGLD